MCTAATYKTKDFYMGRNLDYERSYGDSIIVTPRNYPIRFKCRQSLSTHYALIGMGTVIEDYPLYYEAFNEKGLGICGLNFVGNCAFFPVTEGKENIAQYELIPFILGTCASVGEAREKLTGLNLVGIPFLPSLPLAQLHWIIADSEDCITLEISADGLHIYDNPVGVLTNNPPFPYQMFQLNNYRALGIGTPENTFGTDLDAYSRGMGGMGLPGDLSSQSRFVRVAFTKLNSLSGSDELSSVSQFFHILGSVDQQRGLCKLGEGEFEITLYTCCCNVSKGIYYYTTYDNHQITAVDMHHEDLDGTRLVTYDQIKEQQIRMQN